MKHATWKSIKNRNPIPSSNGCSDLDRHTPIDAINKFNEASESIVNKLDTKDKILFLLTFFIDGGILAESTASLFLKANYWYA